MAKKALNWKNRILIASERRFVREVIRPTLQDLAAVRKEMRAKAPKGKGADPDMLSLYRAELARMDDFETRVKQYADEMHQRFSARGTPSNAS